jgi:threonine synthase
VRDEAILGAQKRLHKQGLMIEATSAAPAAALLQIRPLLGDDAALLIAFTGSGLKSISDSL